MTTGGHSYALLFEPAACRALAKFPRDIQSRLITRIETLGQNPRPHGAVKLSGHDAYRVRVGDYRIIYSVLDDRLLVIVVEIGNRRDVYRGW